MTIIELFQQINPYNFALAYEKLFPYEEYDWFMSRNLKNVFARTNGLLKIIDQIQKGKYKALSKEHVKTLPTIYVFEFKNTRLDEKTTEFEAFTLDSLEIKTLRDFYKHRKEIELSPKFEKNTEYFNYNVAKQSIDTYGIDICAATIFHTLTRMGYDEKTVQHSIEYITKEIEKSEADIKNGKTYTIEEVKEHFAKLDEEYRKKLDKFELAVCQGSDAKYKAIEPLKDEYRKKIEKENIKNLYKFINAKESK